MTSDEEIRDRLRRLHDWAERRPHTLVAPPLPRPGTASPGPQPRRGTAYAAAAAVVLIAMAGHALGVGSSGRELPGRPAGVAADPVGPTTSSSVTGPPPATTPSRGTPASVLPPGPSGSRPAPTTAPRVLSGQAAPPSPSGGDRSVAPTPPPVGAVIGLEPLARPGALVRREDLDLRVAQLPTPLAGTDAAAASFLVRPGLAAPGGLSLESVALPGYFVAVDGDRAALQHDDGTAGFENRATFFATASPTGRGLSFAPALQHSSRLFTVGDALYAQPAGGGREGDGAAFVVRTGLFTEPVNTARTSGWILGPAGRCVDIWGADNGVDGTPAGLWNCEAGSADQQFSHELDFSLRTLGRCLDVVGADTGGVGAEVVLWACQSGARDQQWVQAADGTLRSRASGLCLHVTGGGTADSTRLELNACTGNQDTQFRLT